MIRVISVTKNPLSNLTNEELEKVLNQIESKKGTILHITSDSDEYTIIYKESKQLNSWVYPSIAKGVKYGYYF